MKEIAKDARVSVPATGALAALALLLFIPLFITRGMGMIDFWWWMSIAITVLVALAAEADPGYLESLVADLQTHAPRKILTGVISAAALYGIFYAGKKLSVLLFPFAADDIHAVYALKSGASLFRIVLLMTVIIGPGEELFWRGFLQKAVSERSSPTEGLLTVTFLYTIVHAGSGNFMLTAAAFVAGLAWGWLYLRYRSVLINIVSHTLWDLAVFVLFPL